MIFDENEFFLGYFLDECTTLNSFWHLRMTILPLKHIFFENHHRVAAGCGDAVRSISRLSFGCLVLENT